MQLRFAVAVGYLALAVPLASASAQSTVPPAQATAAAQSTAPAIAMWSFSLGADPTHLDMRTREPGMEARVVANLTRSWQSAHSRWARHISLMVGGDAPVEVQPGIFTPGGPCTDCSMRISSRYAGLTAGASYDLFRVSRFTPYLVGGTGIYYTTLSREPVDAILTANELALYQNGGFYQHNFSVGLNAGLGLKVRIGSHELFIEQMVHRFDIGNLGVGISPLNIGIRF